VKWDELVDAERTLEKHAARYRALYGKKVTLIIDGFDLLAKSDAGLVACDDLLDWARFLANKGDITVVFVASEGRAILKAVRASGKACHEQQSSALTCSAYVQQRTARKRDYVLSKCTTNRTQPALRFWRSSCFQDDLRV
jgi:hypothetical protein